MDNPEPGSRGGFRLSLKNKALNVGHGIKAVFKTSDTLSPPLDTHLSRPTSPVGKKGNLRASSAPPPINRLTPALPCITSQEEQSQASECTATTPVPPQPAQLHTNDNSSSCGTSHSPEEQADPPTPQQKIDNKQRDAIEAIIKDLQSAKDKCKEEQWKYKNSDGELVPVVDKIGRILKGLETYASIVDVAIQHSPETTALVWASVRMIMKVALNYFELIENLEWATATIIDTMATCEFYAHIYKDVSLEVTLHSDLTAEDFKCKLDSALGELYTAVREFAVEVQKYFSSSASGGIKIRSIFMPFQVVMKPYSDKIIDKKKVIRECADGATMKRIMGKSAQCTYNTDNKMLS
ncbi:hypothetical protein BDZ91DRAFT_765141 [Kalaharituber pfeilii]|nr:hypothetical protein BDZ91DRAFT_765141 [Kalaharituber pfeilii]